MGPLEAALIFLSLNPRRNKTGMNASTFLWKVTASTTKPVSGHLGFFCEGSHRFLLRDQVLERRGGWVWILTSKNGSHRATARLHTLTVVKLTLAHSQDDRPGFPVESRRPSNDQSTERLKSSIAQCSSQFQVHVQLDGGRGPCSGLPLGQADQVAIRKIDD